MGQPHSPPARHQSHHERKGKAPPLRLDINETDVRALIEENTRLRKLVVQLSKIVLKNVVEPDKSLLPFARGTSATGKVPVRFDPISAA